MSLLKDRKREPTLWVMTLDEMLDAYDADHQHVANRALHLAGITLIGSGVGLLFPAPWIGSALIALGWAAQLLGHWIEGKPPSLTRDPRFMAVGAVWYVRELGRKLGWRPAARA